MDFEYAIIGGYLEIDKVVFTKEMLRTGSRLRKLINSADLSQKPKIIKSETNNSCIIDYTHSAEVELDDNYQEVFQSLSQDYPGKIKGKITIMLNSSYSTFITELSV